ncbi:hypothetical protein TBS_02900 [Thermobispora bispora]|uniref:Uncharacterized protein n=1 Tax=Thermobispora bispora (strain ATCC 19993 / DSM 43833 / CBS 139.67 / JCM 10125 / KCTC 9307 / NBRC 14880 / R51) TaxID=469371 RepID=D6Y9B0_THEBD|nr:hypothetical protein [Thermobispora bispora]ADG88030.1 hypothetical protein Tbis_1311 [Thermobispora bispora DSM 43833]MBX6167682.1 hypothetical protein [Thermobispora bispora]MDI9580544.1 hypothetical protein [Thermobispora sp.]
MTPQSDEDEVWRQIVASFHQPEDPSAGQPWPDRENVTEDDPVRREPAGACPAAAVEEPVTGEDEDDDDDHFVPPPPPPLPKGDAISRLSWAALFGGPAYLLLAAMLGWPMDGWIVFAAVAAFIAGFVTLVVRLGDGPPPDSGWDNGAVV